jgi:HD-GYP domain-containing protein (c-di-GMP phosphodiesterase class II)
MRVDVLVVELRGMGHPGGDRMVRTARDLRIGRETRVCRDAVHRGLAEREPFLVARLGPAFEPGAAAAPPLHAAGSAFVPLVVGGKAIGVLHVHRRSASFEADDLRVLVALAAQLALTAQNLDLMRDLKALYLGIMATLADAVEARDAYTGGHCKRVSDLSVRLAEAAGLPASEVEEIRVGSLVHDVGKIGIPDQILGKPGRLTPEEMDLVRRHTVIGERLIAPLPVSQTVRDVILCHHERYNGAGYPGGLRGEAIPMSARIVAIADAFEAMTSGRVYRPPILWEQALTELRRASGAQLDPYLVELFLHLLETEDLAPPPAPAPRVTPEPAAPDRDSPDAPPRP